MSLIDDAPEGANTPEYSVSELSRGVKRTLESTYGHVRVRGELGRVTFHRNGHVYLDLKDDTSVLAGVVWKTKARQLDIRPQEGDEVIATGRITTFPGQSKYQLVIEQLAYAGEGALLARLERLKKALAAEGLFEEQRKQALPWLPAVIGVVTSPTGAVIRDILHRLAERFPVHVLVWPVAVQGPGCAGEVAAAIRGFGALPADGPVPRPDVLIVARGGGSIEDLWGFNEEEVVRAAAASTIPLISAVGHETDTTLIDFAADRRAPTPTAAAEIAVPVRAELLACVADFGAREERALARMVEARRQRLRDLGRALPRPIDLVETRRQRLAACRLPDPARIVVDRRQRLEALGRHLAPCLRSALDRARRRLSDQRLPDLKLIMAEKRSALDGVARNLPHLLARRSGQARLALSERMGRLQPQLLRRTLRDEALRVAQLGQRLEPAARRRIEAARGRLAADARILGSLSEARTLVRGFAIVRDAEGRVLTSASGIGPGTALDLEFRDGHVRAIGEGGGRRGSQRRAKKPEQTSLFDEI